jgi:hypothetical protein
VLVLRLELSVCTVPDTSSRGCHGVPSSLQDVELRKPRNLFVCVSEEREDAVPEDARLCACVSEECEHGIKRVFTSAGKQHDALKKSTMDKTLESTLKADIMIPIADL